MADDLLAEHEQSLARCAPLAHKTRNEAAAGYLVLDEEAEIGGPSQVRGPVRFQPQQHISARRRCPLHRLHDERKFPVDHPTNSALPGPWAGCQRIPLYGQFLLLSPLPDCPKVLAGTLHLHKRELGRALAGWIPLRTLLVHTESSASQAVASLLLAQCQQSSTALTTLPELRYGSRH